MSKAKKCTIAAVIITTAVLITEIVIGIVLFVLRRQGGSVGNEIIVNANGEATQTADFALDEFYPGKTQGYTFRIKNKIAGLYKVELNFASEAQGSLDGYVNATVAVNGGVVREVALSELLNGDPIVFSRKFGAEAVELTVRFTMPVEVGNEAQNTSTDFKATLVISSEV